MDIFFETIVSEWDAGLSEMYESSLSTDMIETSVERACDFFHIDHPADINAGPTTGVRLGDMGSYSDDIQFYNRTQLESMGITGQDGLDLVMTHEGTHRILQGMETGFDSYQEELCCDYMAGVRAGLNGMDVSQLENSLIDTSQGLEHPEGSLRVDAIGQGMAFAQSYMETHTLPPTFNECLEDFQGEHMYDMANLARLHHEVLAEECTMEHYRNLMESEPGNEQAEHNFLVSQERYHHALSEYNHQCALMERDGGESTGSMGRNEETEEFSRNASSNHNSPSFRGSKSDQEWEEWYTKRANEAYRMEGVWTKEAQKALETGDESLAKKDFDRAKAYHNEAKRHADSAKIYANNQ